jgi:tRNA modification GTPase
MTALNSGSFYQDTIAAIATAPGRGGIGVIRLSGDDAQTIALALTHRRTLTPRYAHYTSFHDDHRVIDDGIAIFFPGPHSFTGEDVVELQGHGGPVILQLLLRRCFDLGARQARAGEFSERAFLNDKLDLVQAEAIADLINAQTATAARQAQASLRGTFSDAIDDVREQLVSLRKYVEAAIDFPEEEIDFLSEGRVTQQLNTLLNTAKTLRANAKQGAIFRSGATVVLAGRPNAGKSSLLNALAEDQVAIVTDVPGTTRDVVRQHVEVDGVALHLTDTAGLRESDDAIEQEGIKRAQKAISEADLTIHLIDDNDPHAHAIELPATNNLLTVLTKIDLSGRPGGVISSESSSETASNDAPAVAPAVAISSKTGAGLSELKKTILTMIGIDGADDTLFSARERHLLALDLCLTTLEQAKQQFLSSGAGELLAEDLRRAHDQLGDITGRMTSDELLGEIFSSFCIGK